MKLYDKIFPPRVIELPNGKQVFKYRSRAPLAVLVLLFLTVLSVKVTGFNMNVLARRIGEFFVILRKCFRRTGVISHRYGSRSSIRLKCLFWDR